MSVAVETEIDRFMRGLKRRNPHEPEFHQAVEEVVRSIMPRYLDNAEQRRAQILERMTEPDRVVMFRVPWETDDGEIRANRAWRVQFNHALGPYKGGLRFARDVDLGVLKFLGFDQTFKNSLTGLPMGGAKGGANFNPKGKSDREIMRFCHSLMSELHRHIGEDTDVPAGDIGVGEREISYLFGQYMRLENRWTGVLTGKGCSFGGSAVRKEATGYGCVYFAQCMLERHGTGMGGTRIAISGAGNVALYAAEKAMQIGAKVVTLSDSDGYVEIDGGLNEERLDFVKDLKERRRGRLSEFADGHDGVTFHEGENPWRVPCDVAMPCAIQNEIDEADAEALLAGGVRAVCEGANMPSTSGAARLFRNGDILYAPGKAANAGGVAVSGLEQSQNAMRVAWSREEVDSRLQEIVADIHRRCVEHGRRGERVDYVDGANRAAFGKLADAMLAYGVA